MRRCWLKRNAAGAVWFTRAAGRGDGRLLTRPWYGTPRELCSLKGSCPCRGLREARGVMLHSVVLPRPPAPVPRAEPLGFVSLLRVFAFFSLVVWSVALFVVP